MLKVERVLHKYPIHLPSEWLWDVTDGGRLVCSCVREEDAWDIATLLARLEEWQSVGSRIQEAATGKPGPLSDSDVIGELAALRAQLEAAQAQVARVRAMIQSLRKSAAFYRRVGAALELGIRGDTPAMDEARAIVLENAARRLLAALDGEGDAS